MSTERQGSPSGQLIDLVLDPQELGYRAAAGRKPSGARPRWYERPLVALGCLLIGFVLVVAYIHTHRGAPQAAKVHQGLVARVHAAQQQGDTLASSAAALDERVSTLRNRELGNGGLADELSREQVLAGRTAVTGPGLQVVLREPSRASTSTAPGRVGAEPIGATHILTDRDVRSVVNQLWSDGAEAVAVNGVRLTPNSAIRFAGEVILVDLQPITSPYTVDAIGAPDALATGFAASAVAGRYQTLASARGIGFSFAEKSSMTLPAGVHPVPGVARVPTATPSPR